MSEEHTVTITRQSGYQFLVDFGAWNPLLADEPAPLGTGVGPAPEHLLLASVANCLAASLLFAVQKYKQDPGDIVATAKAILGRNERQRLRIERIEVSIRLGKNAREIDRLDRVLAQFEDFCTVSMSVQQGIALSVAVSDAGGARLK